MHQDHFTEKVRMIAMNHGLEQITKSSVSDLSEGLVELYHSILVDLINVSRSARNMNTISNLRQATEGDQVSRSSMFERVDLICNLLSVLSLHSTTIWTPSRWSGSPSKQSALTTNF